MRLSDDSAGQAQPSRSEIPRIPVRCAQVVMHAVEARQAAHNPPLQNSAETDIEGGVHAALPLACVSANYGPVALSPAIKARRPPPEAMLSPCPPGVWLARRLTAGGI